MLNGVKAWLIWKATGTHPYFASLQSVQENHELPSIFSKEHPVNQRIYRRWQSQTRRYIINRRKLVARPKTSPRNQPIMTEPAADLLASLELTTRVQSRIVPPEVLALPQTVAEISAIVARTAAAAQERLAQQQESFFQNQEHLAQKQDTLFQNQERLARSQDRLDQKLEALALQQELLGAKQDRTDAQIAEFKATVQDFIAEQRQINADSKRRHDHLYGEVSVLKGQAAEQLVAANLGECRVDYDRDLTEIAIRHCLRFSEPGTAAAIADAFRAGIISPTERRQLIRADIIATAVSRPTRETSYFLPEVSSALYDADLDRVALRAQICAKTLNVPVQPLAIGAGCTRTTKHTPPLLGAGPDPPSAGAETGRRPAYRRDPTLKSGPEKQCGTTGT